MPRSDNATPQPVDIAWIEEQSNYSGAGSFFIVAMIFWNVILGFLFLDAGNVLRASVIGLLWIAGNQIWSLGVLLGHRRKLIIRRWPQQ